MALLVRRPSSPSEIPLIRTELPNLHSSIESKAVAPIENKELQVKILRSFKNVFPFKEPQDVEKTISSALQVLAEKSTLIRTRFDGYLKSREGTDIFVKTHNSARLYFFGPRLSNAPSATMKMLRRAVRIDVQDGKQVACREVARLDLTTDRVDDKTGIDCFRTEAMVLSQLPKDPSYCELLDAHPLLLKPEAEIGVNHCFMYMPFYPWDLFGLLMDKVDVNKNDQFVAMLPMLFNALLRQINHIHGDPMHVVHADLKPENIFCDGYGHFLKLKIGDWGTVNQTYGRSPSYLPPEHLYKECTGTMPGDVWSMGCVFLTMLNRFKMPWMDLLALLDACKEIEIALKYRQAREEKEQSMMATLSAGASNIMEIARTGARTFLRSNEKFNEFKELQAFLTQHADTFQSAKYMEPSLATPDELLINSKIDQRVEHFATQLRNVHARLGMITEVNGLRYQNELILNTLKKILDGMWSTLKQNNSQRNYQMISSDPYHQIEGLLREITAEMLNPIAEERLSFAQILEKFGQRLEEAMLFAKKRSEQCVLEKYAKLPYAKIDLNVEILNKIYVLANQQIERDDFDFHHVEDKDLPPFDIYKQDKYYELYLDLNPEAPRDGIRIDTVDPFIIYLPIAGYPYA